MFKLILKLAWNNAFLRLSRTLLVIIMIAVSMSMLLAIQGLFDGMAYNMSDKMLRSDSGEISIYHKDYRLNKIIANHVTDAKTIKAKLEQDSEVQAVVTRFSVDGLSATARKSSFANIIGINLEDEEKFGQFSDFLKKGTLDFKKRGALIGGELAKTLKVKVGSKLVFSTQDKNGDINSIALRIRGILRTANVKLDTSAIFIDAVRLDKFLGIDKNIATQIAIRTQSSTLQDKLKKDYPNLSVKNFLEINPMMQMMEDSMVIFNSMIFVIVMFVVFIGILGVMYVSILDRIREFGIMRGIGMKYSHIRLQIILEALFVGLMGYLVGALFGFSGLYYLENVGLDLSAYADAMESFGYETILYAEIKLSYFTNTFYAIFTASLLSVFLPLRKIKKMHPIDVIKADT